MEEKLSKIENKLDLLIEAKISVVPQEINLESIDEKIRAIEQW